VRHDQLLEGLGRGGALAQALVLRSCCDAQAVLREFMVIHRTRSLAPLLLLACSARSTPTATPRLVLPDAGRKIEIPNAVTVSDDAGPPKPASRQSQPKEVVDLTPPDTIGISGVVNGLDYSSVLNTARRYQPQIMRCYMQTLKMDPTVKGKLVLTFTVGVDGGVKEADVEFVNTAVASCAKQAAETWRFDKPTQDTTFRVTFVLATT
jgi:hypothetical protein